MNATVLRLGHRIMDAISRRKKAEAKASYINVVIPRRIKVKMRK